MGRGFKSFCPCQKHGMSIRAFCVFFVRGLVDLKGSGSEWQSGGLPEPRLTDEHSARRIKSFCLPSHSRYASLVLSLLYLLALGSIASAKRLSIILLRSLPKKAHICLSRQMCAFFNDGCLRQMILASPHFMANITSLRHAVERASF